MTFCISVNGFHSGYFSLHKFINLIEKEEQNFYIFCSHYFFVFFYYYFFFDEILSESFLADKI